MSTAPLDPKSDAGKALSARFADLDAKYAPRQAEAEAAVERANSAVCDFKAAPCEIKKTKIGMLAFSRAEIGDDVPPKKSPG